MCEGIVKEVGPAIYNEIISAKLATRMKIRVAGATNQTGYCNAALGRRQFGQVTIQNWFCVITYSSDYDGFDAPLADNETDNSSADSAQDKDWRKGLGDNGVGQA